MRVMLSAWAAIAAVLAPAPLRAQTTATAPGVALGVRFTDEFNGFSLRPPLITERLRETSPRRLVAWVRRDDRTGAIRWTLEVLRTRHEPSKLPRQEYVKAIADELGKVNRFHVQSTELGTVAGKPAMHFRGLWKGALELWRRQTWLEVAPGEHLVLDIAGPVADQGQMDAVLTAAVGTLELFDPSAALERRRQDLLRGAEVLGGLNEQKLRDALVGEPYYFLLQYKGKTIGFVKVAEAMATREKDFGLLVVRTGALKLPDQPRRLTREELFATPDRNVERWLRVVVDGQGKETVTTTFQAIKQDNLLLVDMTQGERPLPSQKRTLPETIRPAYLPQALDVLAARLVDRARAASYGFAVYNSSANDFDLRTVSVVGPDKTVLGGQTLPTTHLTDQMARDAPPADVWVDAKGLVLRMQTSDGLIVERADASSVSAKFTAEIVETERLKPRRK